MRVIKILGAALLGCAALLSAAANAQTPVSCNWASIGTENPPINITIVYHQCKQTNGTLIANRQLIINKTTGAVQQCTLTPEAGYTYTGSCLQPSFSTQAPPVIPPASSCTTPGVQVHGGCANNYNPSFLTNPTYLARCGTGCTLEYQSQGWTNGCPPGNAGSSPQYGLFCK